MRIALVFLLTVGARVGPAAGEKAIDEDPGWKPATIGFLVVDGVFNTELVAPFDVLQHVVGRVSDPPRVFTVALHKDPVTTHEGLNIVPDYVLEEAPPIDILIVASAEHSMDSDLENQRLIDWVRKAGMKARHAVSLCWGAFVLAKAGLLDGGPATTFPADQDRLQEDFPEVRVIRGVSFVDAGHALTSVGGVKSYEVAMYLAETIYGEGIAKEIGQGLVMDWNRSKVKYYRK